MLLVGAVLLARSLVRLTATDDGFSSRQVVTATIQLPETAERPAVVALWRSLLDDLRRQPGLERLSAINQMPLNEFLFIRGDYTVEGHDSTKLPWAAKPKIASGYFRAMGIPVVRGRDFAVSDDAGAPPVAIVSELFARMVFGDADPTGTRISLAAPGQEPWFTIVGVVGDIRQSGPADTPVPAVYVPYAQSEGTFFIRTLSLVVPTSLEIEAVSRRDHQGASAGRSDAARCCRCRASRIFAEPARWRSRDSGRSCSACLPWPGCCSRRRGCSALSLTPWRSAGRRSAFVSR